MLRLNRPFCRSRLWRLALRCICCVPRRAGLCLFGRLGRSLLWQRQSVSRQRHIRHALCTFGGGMLSAARPCFQAHLVGRQPLGIVNDLLHFREPEAASCFVSCGHGDSGAHQLVLCAQMRLPQYGAAAIRRSISHLNPAADPACPRSPEVAHRCRLKRPTTPQRLSCELQSPRRRNLQWSRLQTTPAGPRPGHFRPQHPPSRHVTCHTCCFVCCTACTRGTEAFGGEMPCMHAFNPVRRGAAAPELICSASTPPRASDSLPADLHRVQAACGAAIRRDPRNITAQSFAGTAHLIH